MKKSAIVFLCIVFVLQLSACSSKSKNESTTTSETTQTTTEAAVDKSGTDTVTVNGVVYRNKFAGSMEYTGSNNTDGKTPLLENTDGSFYHVDDATHDWIYKDGSEETINGEYLYCRDDQWQELHEFYSNPDNLDATCLIVANNAKEEYKTIQNVDADKFNKMIEFYNKNHYDSGSKKNVNARVVDVSFRNGTKYYFSIASSDKLFLGMVETLLVIDGKLVMAYFSDAFTQQFYVVDFPDEISDYFVSEINKLS